MEYEFQKQLNKNILGKIPFIGYAKNQNFIQMSKIVWKFEGGGKEFISFFVKIDKDPSCTNPFITRLQTRQSIHIVFIIDSFFQTEIFLETCKYNQTPL